MLTMLPRRLLDQARSNRADDFLWHFATLFHYSEAFRCILGRGLLLCVTSSATRRCYVSSGGLTRDTWFLQGVDRHVLRLLWAL